MKSRSCFLLFILLVVASLPACSNQAPTVNKTKPVLPVVVATRTLPPSSPTITHAPNAKLTAQVFLNAWKADDYQTMYNLLTPTSQDAIALDKFTRFYKDAAISMTLQKLEYE